MSTFYRAATRPDLAAPPARERGAFGAGYSQERHHRYEGPAAYVTIADTLTAVYVFSGHPDRIDLSARTNPAFFVLDDLDGREADPIFVAAGTTVQVHVPRRRVQARNVVAGSNADVNVTGFYDGPAYRFDAPVS